MHLNNVYALASLSPFAICWHHTAVESRVYKFIAPYNVLATSPHFRDMTTDRIVESRMDNARFEDMMPPAFV